MFDTLLDGSHDATWIFCHHEGVIAARKGIELNIFKLEDHGVDYGYPLVIVRVVQAFFPPGSSTHWNKLTLSLTLSHAP